MNQEEKDYIDSLPHCALLERWRNAPMGDPWFQGEKGRYWGERMKAEKEKNPGGAVQDSKDIGWDGP